MAKFKSFRFFTESAKSLQLWRFAVRTAHRAPAPQRKELIDWARAEFEAHRNEEDPEQIRYLVSEGLKRVRELGQTLQYSEHVQK